MKQKVLIANDHSGTQLKQAAIHFLTAQGCEVVNLGVDDEDAIDYPDIFVAAAKKLLAEPTALGVFICGTGIGACITLNKISTLHCALVHNGFTARMAKKHNHCRLIALGARVVNHETLVEILQAFLNAVPEGGRHSRRIQKIIALEQMTREARVRS